MCGFAGFLVRPGGQMPQDLTQVMRRMGAAIAHRGPDGEGYWHDPSAGIALIHRRLAVVDLSPMGAQPMRSESGRYVIAFNGEIYNHRQLRKRLDGKWRGTSDTETLLAGFETWGIPATLEAATGMFAFAVWDLAERSLVLGRDRFGEKPLYYGWQKGGSTGDQPHFLFASDLAAIRAHPAFSAKISRDALRTYMRFNNVGGSSSIYSDISKLSAGTFLTVRFDDLEARPIPYWSSMNAIQHGVGHRFNGNATEAADALEGVLRDAVGQQMVADVPLGAFLSGGVDSSTIAALMQAQSQRPVRTFTIGFDEDAFNEAGHARAVAQHLGTDHTEVHVRALDALSLIPDLPAIYSEPFADSSQIPTFLLSKLTRSHVTVALSGDCGDELFGGYNRYQFTHEAWPQLSRIPLRIRGLVAKLIERAPPGSWNDLAMRLRRFFRSASRWNHVGEKMHKGARVLASSRIEDLYTGMLSHWLDPAEVVLGGVEPEFPPASLMTALRDLSSVEKMMALDFVGYMSDDILAKVDRAAMGVSLETRVPMLDPQVVNFAWRLPMEYKLRNAETKWLLRQVLYRHVPKQLIERPKSGFSVPVGSWLRGPLRDWAEDLLDPARIRREGYFNPAPIREKWEEHLMDRHDWHAELWTTLMFQSWLARNHG